MNNEYNISMYVCTIAIYCRGWTGGTLMQPMFY